VQSQQFGIFEPTMFKDSSNSNSQDAGIGDLLDYFLIFPKNHLKCSQPLENIDANRIALYCYPKKTEWNTVYSL
jgi:hypothetical protein